jgi:ferritin-like metal-binding protein YciE
MERQADEFKDQPDVSALITRIHRQLNAQKSALDARLTALGGSPTNPIKEGVAGAAGVIAGLYNKIRTEGASKGLRDDHVALNWTYVSYMTLVTTAVALGDRETASIAERGMRECARAAMDVQKLIPGVVVRELQDGKLGTLDPTAVEEARNATTEAWEGGTGGTGGAGITGERRTTL